MYDTLLIILLLALNGLTCCAAYLIGHKAGLRDGFEYARRQRMRASHE